MMNRLLLTIPFFLCICLFSRGIGKEPSSPDMGEVPTEGKQANRGSETGEQIDRYLSAMEALGFSGAVIVSEGEDVVLRKGYGLADRETRRPYTPSTIQSHGSITKEMTAAAILLLESRGELSVGDSIAGYFDNVPKEKRGITIHQLLTHSSGLPGGIGPDEEYIGTQAYVERLMQEPLQFVPGTGYGYSNAGYALLGILIEQLSGKDYEAFLRNELLLPAGLAETGYLLPDWDQDRLAVGYRNGRRWGLVYERGWTREGPGWHLRANGGLHTTVEDMYRWYRSTLRDHTVVNSEIVRRWTTPHVTESNGVTEYAYGWVVSDSEWGRMISHSGSNRIFSADFVWLPEKDVFFYIQGNTSMMPAYLQRTSILEAAFKPEIQMPPIVKADTSASPKIASEREGVYRFEEGSLELTADDTRLFARLTGQKTLDMLLNHTEEQQQHFAALNRRTMDAMKKLEAGQQDALAGITSRDDDPVDATRELLDRIAQIGNLQSLNLIGSFENVPGSRLAEYGPWTTFVYAKFENWNQYWNLVWNSDDTYRGNFSGPWPTFILVPTAVGEYRGVRQGHPWNMTDIRFENDCLLIDALVACPE
jgi:CubicO group peptidase (beta-lactamase class C family)